MRVEDASDADKIEEEIEDMTMSLDINRPDLTVGVVGTGAMGRGIAQVTAQGGIKADHVSTRRPAGRPRRRRASSRC